jgi:LPS export ABC transporter protein LptC
MPRITLQVLLAIALVLAANYYWNTQHLRGPDDDTSARQGDLPQTYLEQTRAWSFDQNGDLTDILEADRVEQFSRGRVSLLTRPRFYVHSGDDKTWSAVAERGRFEEHSERLLLRRKVVLRHDQTGLRLDTHALDIEVDDKTATSQKKVTVTQGSNRTTADGLFASLNDETITLKPNVETTYEPLP